MDKIDMIFVKAVKAMEARTHRVKACVVIDPSNANHHGRVVISYPADGAGRVHVVAWLPNGVTEQWGFGTARHHGHAGGGGYDKASAAMSDAPFFNLATGQPDTLKDSGHDWMSQLRKAGYIVVQAC